ncbi:flagellar basal body P-ring formation chaperone FlgA [Sulfitobacter sp. HGT1]|uniref:flagellar basal body P-ring formation chaperone FlgA n=1 Tax=Sulfitobacter sp. HGT1 TaxID=2735435 RepID=UPI001594A537|nr:flagellar basal body P-ring formation chaperone FlgA [Sulfitobacter sp. HGT1]
MKLIRSLTRLYLGVLAAVILASVATAESIPVTELVEERTMAELGATIPVNGRMDIQMAEGMISSGRFIQEFWIDHKTGQFIANVMTDANIPQRVWGVVIINLSVPVPNQRLQPDQIVSRSDITMVDMPMQRLGSFAISDVDELVGQQVRRMLVAGRPVPRQSVMPPRIITRGEDVKIQLNYGGLRLTAKGKAMADAHAGEEIRVVNLSSNKAISAIATGAGIVEVVR